MVAKRLISVALLLLTLATLVPAPVARAQGEAPPEEVLRLFEALTPEERVGQLFLVTFTGMDTSIESQIYDLITNYHVGGVVLLAGNNNFAPAPNTIAGTHELITDLQRIEWQSSDEAAPEATTSVLPQRAYIPLFVGIEQEGGGPPTDQILSGLTAIPNAMALGATWRPELAQQVGQVQGRELSALGFNLFVGPSLDVLDVPNPSAHSSVETRSFGGDPYWVGEMGRGYISGLHIGSNGRMLVIAKHFPGLGSSDRPVDEEVATVRKSLEQLRQIELAPFFDVTGRAPNVQAMADGLLVSHIRFQGFQGNIRAATRPVSFDPSALGEILDLQEIAAWRESGGLIVSDDLGSRAVRFFYAPSNEGFSADIVARDAFLAGNDILYLGNIVSSDLDDTYTTNQRILNFFAQRYREDPAFAQQVDQAVLRILTRKYQLFERFQLPSVLVPANGLAAIGGSQQLVYDVARRSATLVSPDVSELTSLLPSPPVLRDRLVFITDTVQYQQCSTCPVVNTALSLNAMQEAVVRLYGPNAAGQISTARLSSYTFDDLTVMFNSPDLDTMEENISRATWVVFLLSGSSKGQPELVSRFLAERQDLLREKRLILFSFTAPYYFDATDISKFSAYYGLYSKEPAFIDVAARLLFQELTPLGYSPVSIPATGYDLIEVTRPHPDQVITLSLDRPPNTAPTGLPTPIDQAATQTAVPTVPPEPTAIPLLGIGDTIYIRTGVIYDRNNHPVPDGTVVRFTMLLSGQGGGIIQQSDQITVRGVAQASFALENPGLVEIKATSDPATVSDIIRLDVSSGQPAAITVIVPFPTETAEPTPIPPTPVPIDPWINPDGYPLFSSWILVVLFIVLSASLAFWAGSSLQSQRWGFRWGVCVLLGGLAGYNATALGWLGSTQIVMAGGLVAVLGMSALGELIGLGLGWMWSQRS